MIYGTATRRRRRQRCWPPHRWDRTNRPRSPSLAADAAGRGSRRGSGPRYRQGTVEGISRERRRRPGPEDEHSWLRRARPDNHATGASAASRSATCRFATHNNGPNGVTGTSYGFTAGLFPRARTGAAIDGMERIPSFGGCHGERRRRLGGDGTICSGVSGGRGDERLRSRGSDDSRTLISRGPQG